MPVNITQALTSKNFIRPFNRWFIRTTSLLYLWLALCVTWTRTMRLIVLVTYMQWGLIQLIKCKRPHLKPSKLSSTLNSTLKNLAILSAVLLTFVYATVFLFINGSNWELLRQLLLAVMICSCLLGTNLIVLKRMTTLS